MNEDRYDNIKNAADFRAFTFVSRGRHGDFVKVVRFDELIIPDNTYNLALGTLLENGKIDFDSITNNGDRNKILVTVVSIAFMFTDRYPGKKIYLTGSDKRRTLLYKRAIIYGYEELVQTFTIYGETSAEDDTTYFELFDKTKTYSGFLIERK